MYVGSKQFVRITRNKQSISLRWALPPQMAEAGFYHQPNTPESDRAVCFLCHVCLICWEPSDEPW